MTADTGFQPPWWMRNPHVQSLLISLPFRERFVRRRAKALLDANPERIIWGTDWPHVMMKGAMPNDGELADVIADWVPDARMREQVLVHNSARLYGF